MTREIAGELFETDLDQGLRMQIVQQ